MFNLVASTCFEGTGELSLSKNRSEYIDLSLFAWRWRVMAHLFATWIVDVSLLFSSRFLQLFDSLLGSICHQNFLLLQKNLLQLVIGYSVFPDLYYSIARNFSYC